MLLFELAWRLSRDSAALLWLACVGLSDQLVSRRMERDNYTLMVRGGGVHGNVVNWLS